MLELVVTVLFAAIIAAGVVQLVRARPAIGAARVSLGAPSELSAEAFERRAMVAQWESQRDLLAAAVLLLLAGAALTSLGDPIRSAWPAWDHGIGVAVFFAVGIAGVAFAIARGSARARRLGLRCPSCHETLPTGGDRMRDTLRTGRCPQCRAQLFTPLAPR